jgi:formate hydrogenlyase transcriptional activator
LFGHERGAFTGAITQKIGRLELADGGTLFLDEVGDIPLELQPKLLRVLQDQEFERLGSNRTLKVNIRLIAATNRNLAKLVQDKQFRSDLFYRLSVFPIHLPPLRERRSDIPLLVRYFCKKHARRMDKAIDTIPTQTMKTLREWEWPGNVRELENFMERSVILSEGNVLHSPLSELTVEPGGFEGEPTLEEAERKYIIRILDETRGLISGPRGAAVRLGLKRTTLQSRMRRLNIRSEDYGR